MPSRIPATGRLLCESSHLERTFGAELPSYLSKVAGSSSEFLHRDGVEERRSGQDTSTDSLPQTPLPQHETITHQLSEHFGHAHRSPGHPGRRLEGIPSSEPRPGTKRVGNQRHLLWRVFFDGGCL